MIDMPKVEKPLIDGCMPVQIWIRYLMTPVSF